MSEPRDAELRGNVPKKLLQMIDALMQAGGYDNRMDVVVPVMQDYVDKKLHEATMLCRMAGVNPFESEPIGDDLVLPRLGVVVTRSRGVV